jgi:hypothetical protein
MQSRAARLTFGAVAWIAIAAAAIFLIDSERQLSERRVALRAFDLHAREAADALADARAAQQAYVAAGQDVAFWIPKVAGLLQSTTTTLDTLRQSTTDPDAGNSLLQASAGVTELRNVDKRAREYIRAGQPLMAGDVVFTEGGEVAAGAARQIEVARLGERQAFDAHEARLGRLEASALGAAAGISALILALLALGPTSKPAAVAPAIQVVEPSAPIALRPDLPRGSAPALRAAADLCTEFGRVNDLADLRTVLGRAADVMDASGVIVWVGNTSGADLRPVLAHGYSEQALARMPRVSREADNAAAAAYRTGEVQIVLSRPGNAHGAIVAPFLSADGTIGALTAEIKDGGEAADGVQALAAIFAAQLTGVLAASVSAQLSAPQAQDQVASA